MATTKCFDCKKEISQSANKCPHCGSTVPNYSTLIAGVIALGVTAFILKGCFF